MQAVVNQSFHLILFIWGTKSGIDIVEGHARITNFKATILWTLYIGTKLLKWYYFMHAWNMCMTFPKHHQNRLVSSQKTIKSTMLRSHNKARIYTIYYRPFEYDIDKTIEHLSISSSFSAEASLGLRVWSLPTPVCVSARASITSSSAR